MSDDLLPDDGAPQVPETPAPAELPVDASTPAEPPAGVPAGYVPVTALQSEREKARGYKANLEEVSTRLSRLEEERQAADARHAEVLAEFRRHAPSPPATPPAPPPDLWENPADFVRTQVGEYITPVEKALEYNSRLVADAVAGKDKVDAALTAFNALAARNAVPPAEYRAVMDSPNKYHAAVHWHQSQQRAAALSKFGDDPEAHINAEVERRLAERLVGGTAAPTVLPRTIGDAPSQGPRGSAPLSGPKTLSEIMKR